MIKFDKFIKEDGERYCYNCHCKMNIYEKLHDIVIYSIDDIIEDFPIFKESENNNYLISRNPIITKEKVCTECFNLIKR